jgi:glycosyltransferase involved in cell wall biosynthesis
LTKSIYFAYPGDIEARTGGYGYDRKVISELRKLGWDVQLVPLGDGFPFPTAPTLTLADERLCALREGSVVLIDGLAFGTFGQIAQRHSQSLNLIALVHHPLALEGGLTAEAAAGLAHSEKQALSYARAILVTSSTTQKQLVETYGVPASKVTVAVPGTDPGVRARGDVAIPRIISIGSIIPRKGHDVLVLALAQIADLPWQCKIIGSRSMDGEYTIKLVRQIANCGLSDRIILAGQVDDTRSELAHSDIFALASRYEGYGMAFAEALSHGLPIVACRAGAVPEVVPDNAGLLVAPDDPLGFADALRRLLVNEDLRNGMATASFRHGASLPVWADTAQRCVTAIESVTNGRV